MSDSIKKQQLLQELSRSTYATLRPSVLHGIGVFSIKDIPKGTKDVFSTHDAEWIKVSKEEVNALPDESIQLVENFCLYDEDHYYIPEYGFKVFDMAVFLNHSDHPNLISINDGEYFETTRDIICGEELLIDYGSIVTSNE